VCVCVCVCVCVRCKPAALSIEPAMRCVNCRMSQKEGTKESEKKDEGAEERKSHAPSRGGFKEGGGEDSLCVEVHSSSPPAPQRREDQPAQGRLEVDRNVDTVKERKRGERDRGCDVSLRLLPRRPHQRTPRSKRHNP
jgi:hypothetical protein